jgi:hypothetical protein
MDPNSTGPDETTLKARHTPAPIFPESRVPDIVISRYTAGWRGTLNSPDRSSHTLERKV